MNSEPITFYSDGLKLTGQLFIPEDDPPVTTPRPIVIACSGFTGLCHIHPARFARYFTQHGHLCAGFDYRGFADSEGDRGRVLLEEQVRDIMHATACIAGDDRVDADRIVLLGWGMGAGLVIDAARALPGVIGLIAVNGFYVGKRFLREHHDESSFARYVRATDAERTERSRSGRARFVDPFDLYPLDPQSRGYVDAVLRKTVAYEAESYSFELADSLLRWNVEAYVNAMEVPLLVAHGEKNMLHPTREAQALHDQYGGPKSLYWLPGAGHTEFMDDDDPKFQTLASHIEQWIRGRIDATGNS